MDVIQGDCLEIMRGFADNSVDLALCSPPYEKARTYGELKFKLSGQDWVDWMMPRVAEMVRVTKGLVAIVCEGQTRNFQYSATPFLLMADLHRAGYCLRKPVVFHRVGIPGSGGPDWLRNDWEPVVCVTKGGKLPWSDKTAMGHIPKWAPGGEMSNRQSNGARRNKWGKSPKQVNGTSGCRKANGERDDMVRPGDDEPISVHVPAGYVPPALANPGNVIHCKVGGGLMGSRLANLNEAPYPERLCEFFIKSFCPPDGIVLDCFVGSGSTLAVAAKLGRKGIGIDLRESQVELTNRRLEEVSNAR